MNDLSKVGETINANETMTSLEIAEVTGKRHSDVLEAIRTMESAWVKVTKRNFPLSEYKDSTGRNLPMYVLNEKECLYVATKFNDEARAKLINRWEQLEIEKRNGGFIIPQTLSQALMLAAKQAEQIEEQQKLIEVKDTQILELKPKATYYDKILSSNKAECISVFSKSDYGMSGMAMNKLLHDWGIQYKVGKTWLPYQKYASLGYTKTETVSVNNGEDTATHTKWTQQGRLFIYEQMKKHGYLPLIEK